MNTKTKPETLTVNGIRFAPSASALVDSLFQSGGTASGIYSKRKNGVLFKKADGTPFVFLVANPGQSKFFVSCFLQSDNRIRYMFAMTSEHEKFFGFDLLPYSAKSDCAASVWSTLNN